MRISILDNSLHRIGIHAETRDLLAQHPVGKGLKVLEHEHFHGGYVLHVTEEQRSFIMAHASEDFVHDPVRDSRSCAELAVRRAFAQ